MFECSFDANPVMYDGIRWAKMAKANDEEVQARHEQEVQLLTNHNKAKKEAQDKVNADLKKIADDFAKYKAYVD